MNILETVKRTVDKTIIVWNIISPPGCGLEHVFWPTYHATNSQDPPTPSHEEIGRRLAIFHLSEPDLIKGYLQNMNSLGIPQRWVHFLHTCLSMLILADQPSIHQDLPRNCYLQTHFLHKYCVHQRSLFFRRPQKLSPQCSSVFGEPATARDDRRMGDHREDHWWKTSMMTCLVASIHLMLFQVDHL